MIKKIISIDESKCTGCGLCVSACHEGALGIVDGKAKLLRDDYCDGLGNCLPVCPTGAIAFDERGSRAEPAQSQVEPAHGQTAPAQTRLGHWPVQIKLVPVNAPYLSDANLLVAADCTSYAYGNFHDEYMKNRITIIGCPKLDEGDYSEKLTAILKQNSIKSVTIARMEVPCCGGIENAVKKALKNCDKLIPWQVVTISTDGRVLS
ncbi:MAG: 4Fe-4S binding protein [Clostridiales bacterium]|nr:4Fe-4S binding protein [Clostridiales bacterium]